MAVRATPLSETIGVEIGGVDLSQPITADDASRIKAAFATHKVMVISGQDLTVQNLVDFAQRLGTPKAHLLEQFHHPESPLVSILSNRPGDAKSRETPKPAGAYWHADESYKSVPARATMLYSVEIPPTGGDTLYVNTAHAYATLPEATKQRIEDLRAVHFIFGGREGNDAKVTLTPEQIAQTPEVEHPIVRTHPETGEKALYINPGFTNRVVGLDPAEGDALLDDLFAHILRPEFQFRHTWQRGQLVAWDNRAALHCATHDYDRTRARTMHRLMLAG